MTHEEVGRYWNGNAEAWTQLARAGYDVYRDHLNTPAFFDLLPLVTGLNGMDPQDAQVVAYFLHVRARKPGGRSREGRAPEI